MPLSTSSCRGRCDANVATEPGQGAGRRAAGVRGPRARHPQHVRAGRGRPVRARVRLSPGRSAASTRSPALERVAARHRDVKFRIVAVRADAAQARSLGSNLPVGYDHDGAVANEYAVVDLPDDHLRRARRPRRRLDGRPAVRGGDRVVGAAPWLSRRSTSARSRRRSRPSCPGWGCGGASSRVAGDVLRRSPPALRERLRGLSDRHRGATAIALRSRSIPHAYRALFRHLGLEPDEERIPVEALMLERLKRGAYRSRGLLADALTVATLGHGGRRVGGRRGSARGRAAASTRRRSGSSSPTPPA